MSSFFGGMNFLPGGRDLEVRRKPGLDSWGDQKAVEVFTLYSVGVAPRTSETQTGDGFRTRVQSGYTLFIDDEQAAKLKDGDEIVLDMPTGQRTIWGLDGAVFGGNWANPFSDWSGGQEINLKYLRTETTS